MSSPNQVPWISNFSDKLSFMLVFFPHVLEWAILLEVLVQKPMCQYIEIIVI